MDYQRIVDDLRSFVLSNDQRLTASISQLAEEYAEACKEANQRLRRCEEYLKQGMRSEAVQLAETQPALLDLVQAIDFPERPAWDELAATYSLPPAPRLLLESAQALNRAYSEVQPLDNLLRQHRLFALGGACLGERLKLLRQIASRDANNSIWSDDIKEFEAARFREFPGEVDRALVRDELAAIIKIIREFEQEPWLQAPPKHFVKLASGKALDRVGEKLLEAYQLRDEAAARQLQNYWIFLATHTGQLAGVQKQNAEKDLQWLNQLDRKKAKLTDVQGRVKTLEDTLTDGGSLSELEDLYHDLKNLGYALPASLENRYQARRKLLQSREGYQRRERIILTIVCTVGVVVLAAVSCLLFLRR